MAACLRGKRDAERQFSESVSYKCYERQKSRGEKKVIFQVKLTQKKLQKLRDFKSMIKNKKSYDRKKTIKFHTEIVNGVCPDM